MAEVGTDRVKRGLAEMLKGGVIMDVVDADQAKIAEEAQELNEACEREHVVSEAADVAFFVLTRLVRSGIAWHEIEEELDRRSLKVTRRG